MTPVSQAENDRWRPRQRGENGRIALISPRIAAEAPLPDVISFAAEEQQAKIATGVIDTD
ncbi:hypothetical protein [Sphingomonas sp.]|uniref:hypothetical protein n=1 Tax=Sphingomonas sp. TaxID=28214 RepID=UPI0031CDBB5A